MRLGIDLRCLAEGEAGGIALYARELLTRLPAALPEASCVGLRTGFSTHYPNVDFPTQHLRVPNKALNASLVALHRPALDESLGADIFFAPTPKYIALRPSTTFVVTVHDVSFILHPEFFTLQQRVWHAWLRLRPMLQRAQAIIAVSQHTADDLAMLWPELRPNIHVVHSGADHVPSGPLPPLPQFPKEYFLAFAPRETRKNIANLRLAYLHSTAAKRLPLVLVGSGAGGTAPGIIPVPYLGAEERWRALANATALVYPSVYEGFGFPPLEAMHFGVPVLAAHVTSIPEVVGEAALLVDPWDPADLQRGLEALATDLTLRKNLATSGRVRARDFTWQSTAERTAHVLRLAYAHRH